MDKILNSPLKEIEWGLVELFVWITLRIVNLQKN